MIHWTLYVFSYDYYLVGVLQKRFKKQNSNRCLDRKATTDTYDLYLSTTSPLAADRIASRMHNGVETSYRNKQEVEISKYL